MLDDELRALISVEPSPGFEARLRAAITAQPAPSPWWQMRRLWFVPVAAAAAALLVIATLQKSSVEAPKELAMLEARAITSAAPLSARIGSQPPSVTTSKPPAGLGAIQFDAGERRALHALFSSAPAITITTIVPPEDAPIVIPEISIAPLQADDLSKGDRQ